MSLRALVAALLAAAGRDPRRWLAVPLVAAITAAGVTSLGDGREPSRRPVTTAAEEEATTTTAAGPSTTEPATASTASTATAPPPSPAPGVVGMVQQIVDANASGLVVGVAVIGPDGSTVVDHNGGTPMLPASTAKMLTAAAALHALGGHHRYVTKAAVTSPPDAGGVVNGDLVLVGSGDPALGSDTFAAVRPDRPRTRLEDLADAIVASGVRRIAGRVVGDASVFPHAPSAPGWLDSYVPDGDSAPSSGLTVDAGRRVWHEDVRGYQSEPVADPAHRAATVLAQLLAARGVTASGGVASSSSRVTTERVVAEVASPPLADLLRYMMQESDNQIADAVFRTLGAAAGDASWQGSSAAVLRALSAVGLDTGQLALLDGSGLSRGNRVPPLALLEVDRLMTASGHAPLWVAIPAVTAASGTLSRRLVGTVADHRLRGKTGSLRDVNALAATVTAGGKPRWRLAVVGNELTPEGKAAVRALQDEISLALAAEAARCESDPACG